MDDRIDLEKYRSIRMGGKTRGMNRVRKFTDEGRTTAAEIDHHDGRVSAIVMPKTIEKSLNISGKGER